MQKHKVTNKTTEVHELEEITCNKCGTSSVGKEDDYEMNKFQNFYTSFGYGSSYDSETWRFDLCEDCLTSFIKCFMWSPDGFGEDSYIAHDQQKTFEQWKETGIVDLEAGMTHEEIMARGGSIYTDYDYEEKTNESEE